jgi:sialate O-acetylesterase
VAIRCPELKEAEFEVGKALLSFDPAPIGLRPIDSDEVKGFAICGED